MRKSDTKDIRKCENKCGSSFHKFCMKQRKPFIGLFPDMKWYCSKCLRPPKRRQTQQEQDVDMANRLMGTSSKTSTQPTFVTEHPPAPLLKNAVKKTNAKPCNALNCTCSRVAFDKVGCKTCGIRFHQSCLDSSSLPAEYRVLPGWPNSLVNRLCYKCASQQAWPPHGDQPTPPPSEVKSTNGDGESGNCFVDFWGSLCVWFLSVGFFC
jgi:hypothetical protein